MVGRLRTGLGDQGLTVTAIETRVERFAAMGTRIELHLFGAGDADVLFAARRAIESVDDALTIHRPSPTTALNEVLAKGGGAAIDDPLLLAALIEVERVCGLTGGLFDPTVGIAEAGLWDRVTIDRDAARIEVTCPVAFDFGGFGKGYALDRACRILRDGGAPSAFLSAGESSIAVVGEHPLGGGWPVSVPHPLTDATLIELELEDEALSVSSTAGPNAAAPGRTPMIRPTDGRIVPHAATAIAVERSGALAEAMSTALLVADGIDTRRLIDRRPGRRHLFTYRE